jgi:nucleotide-binding universal stress UspA family protein
MYNDILLPTDGSEGMQAVIDHAVSLAEDHGATLHALYAVNTWSLTDLGVDSERVTEALEQEGETALEEVRSTSGDVPIKTTVTAGAPAEVINRYASEGDCDLVVMGTHGRSGGGQQSLGLVARRVVRSADVPVLTVRVDSTHLSGPPDGDAHSLRH